MNKRIRELVKQCGGIGCDDDNQELTPMLAGKDLEKFAELVALECASIVSLYRRDNPGEAAVVLEDAYREIKLHFGVK